MTLDDLRNYRADWVEPISKDYRGYTVHEIPPNGQGIAALIALGILDKFDVRALTVDRIESQHLQIEAMKLAFADVYRYVADPRSMEVTPEQMLDDAYLTERAKLIDPAKASQFDFGMPKAGGTIYMSVADERGMMVSFIQSNYMGFGSGVVVPNTGISLQNRGCGFSMDPKSANVVEGGKRPFHTIIPAFVTQEVDGRRDAVMSFGVMGGDMQPQGHLQSIVRMMDYGQQPQAACDAPRWKVNRDFTIDIEATLDLETARALEGLWPYDQIRRRPVHGFRLRPVHLEAGPQRSRSRLRRGKRQPARRSRSGLLNACRTARKRSSFHSFDEHRRSPAYKQARAAHVRALLRRAERTT